MPRATLLNEFVTFTMPYIPLPRRGPRVVPQTAWLVNESSPNGPVPAHPNGTTTPVCACLLPPTLVAKCALLATLLIDMCFAASWQMCENCVTWEGAFEVELLQGHFKYAYCVLSGFAGACWGFGWWFDWGWSPLRWVRGLLRLGLLRGAAGVGVGKGGACVA